LARVPLTARLARLSARHPWRMLAIWAALLVLAGIWSTGLGNVLGGREMDFLHEPESARGAALLIDNFGDAAGDFESVIVRSDSLTVDDPTFAAHVEELRADLLAQTETVADVTTFYQIAPVDPEVAFTLVSADRRSMLMRVGLEPGAGKRVDVIHEVLGRHSSSDLKLLTIGEASIEEHMMRTAESDLLRAELIGIPLALLMLIGVFGAVAAAGVSLLLAGAAILLAVGLTALVGRVFELSFFVVNVITMIGLAVGIDYALFIIERFREERRAGADVSTSITIAGGTASKTVVFSGGTVILGLLGLFLVPITTFRSLGIGAVLVVSTAVAAMLTLVPAVLSLLGDRVDWPARHLPWGRHGRGAAAREASSSRDGDHFSGFWGRIARTVMRRPVVSVVLTTSLLVGLAIPFLDLRHGNSGAEALPAGQVKEAYDTLASEFPYARLSLVEVVGRGGGDEQLTAGVQNLTALLDAQPLFLAPRPPVWAPAGDVVLLSVPLAVEGNSEEAYTAVALLREQLVPQAFAGTGAEVFVSGESAFFADSRETISGYTPWVFAFVLGLSFVLLMTVFRSIVVPLKAIVMNLLSVGAAYGVLVLVFQKGWGAAFFGFQRTPSIEGWVPMFLFCILFGLSMDYHVFLLSRIREHYDESSRNQESVAMGLRTTGRIITGAALIMVTVFATFASGELVHMQQVGFGLAVAIILDATVIRSVLVPASMALLGDLNWYFPRWLDWLPRMHLEGGHHWRAALLRQKAPKEGRL
jgi:putative drug exporter of the RND superfamily